MTCRGFGLLLVGSVAFLAGCGGDDEGTTSGTPTGSSPVCGNSVVESGETCDDGNTADGDGCSSTCQEETTMGVCGDGTQDPGEDCDDGNTMDGDGCSATCQTETGPFCGDGNVDPGEDCDDGNEEPLDGCENDCKVSPAEIVCQTLAPISSGTCEVTAGTGGTVIEGDVLTPGTILRGGQVVVDDMGMISCVGCDCVDANATETRVVCPDGVVSPGLINAHDHITYIQNNPYNDTGERYEHRHDWRRGLNGHTEIPSTGSASNNAKHWGELRFMIGGATSTIGSGSVAGGLRNLDVSSAQEGLTDQMAVDYDTFPLGDSNGTQLADSCSYPSINTNQAISGEDAYFPHIAEGINAYARNEFFCIADDTYGVEDLLEPQSAFIHSIGLNPMDYARMKAQGTTLVWSPRSNITLYGDTAVVRAAHQLGVRIALGTDWMPTGSMNLQRELACADELNSTYYDGYFDDRELWRMVTVYAAQAAAMDDAIGVLAAGRVADIAIFDGSVNVDYRAIIDAEPDDTALVMRGGQALFGDDAVISALASGTCDPVDVCGANKRYCATDDIGMTYSDLESANSSLYGLFFCGQTPPNEPSCKPMRTVGVDGSNVYSGDPASDDNDGDGLTNDVDNCVDVFNPIRPVDGGLQADFDLDGIGDACDPCPLSSDNNNCPAYDENDLDADGVSNDMDNCPLVPNDQADGDNDQKGDLCDPCPTVSNPGDNACPTTIYAIKTGAVSGAVALENVLVTGCSDGNGYFVQYKPGDPDYTAVENSGVYTYDPNTACGTTITVGDRVTLNPATVNVFFDQIQLSFATITINASMNEAPPAPVLLTPDQASGTLPNDYEAVLATVQNVIVTDDAPTPGPGDNAPTGEFEVDGLLRVNDLLFAVNPLPAVNTVYTSLTGILDYRNGNQKLEPRSSSDLVEGPPILVDVGPLPAFVRVGDVGVATIPLPLEATLSGPAQTNTFVTVTSGSPDLTVVGGGVTIPMGSTSAPILFDGVAQNAAVPIAVTLGTITFNETVRVVGAGEVPQVASINPTSVVVAPSGMASLEVFLDIPARTGGESVALSLNPGTFGSVPPTLSIAADQLSGMVTFTAGSSTGTEVLTADLGGGSAQASIDVFAGGGLLINEVDYDQPGSDLMEFVEIFNATGAPINLTGYSLVFVNGSNNSTYRTVDLGVAGTLGAGEYLVVGSSALLATVPGGVATIAFAGAQDNIQNGAPDGLVIIDTNAMTVIDALSYEGSITAAMVTGLSGTVNLVEGTATSFADDNAIAGSLSRIPNGADTDDASVDWAFSMTSTPGAANM